MPTHASKILLSDATEFAAQLLSHYPHDEAGGKALAIAKIEDLLSRYAKSTVTKGLTKAYREAIYAALYGHDFPGKAASEKQRSDYYAAPVNWFTVPEVISNEVNKTTQVNLGQHRDLTIVFPDSLIDELLDKAVSLVTSPPLKAYDFYAMGVALELLIGRRQYSEILTTSTYRPLSPQIIRVEKPAKTALPWVDVPVLALDSQTVCEAIESIREFLKGRGWWVDGITSNQVKDKVDKVTRDAIDREFQPILNRYYGDLLARYGKEWVQQFPPFSTHDFRSLYGVICYHRLNRESSDIGVYVKSVLGHTSENSTKHYQLFRIKTDSEFSQWKKTILPSYFS